MAVYTREASLDLASEAKGMQVLVASTGYEYTFPVALMCQGEWVSPLASPIKLDSEVGGEQEWRNNT